jgi:hypothetical protein
MPMPPPTIVIGGGAAGIAEAPAVRGFDRGRRVAASAAKD